MRRFAAIVVFAGAVILSTHMLAPAAPPAAKPVASTAALAAVQQATPMIDQVKAEVDRLRERLAAPPAYPAPTRDPFRFGKRAEPSPPKPAESIHVPPIEPAAPPAPMLPQLVAIAATTIDREVIHTAVLMVGDDIQMLKVGDTISRLVIRGIGTDVVDLEDPITGRWFRLSLH